MGDEPFTTLRPISTQGSARSTSQHQAAYAAQRAAVLFGSYRRGDANDPDAYVAAISAVLSLYDADLIREVTDPRTGIMTTEKYMSFMPNAGELKVYCDSVSSKRANFQRLAALPKPIHSRPIGHGAPLDLANSFMASNHPRYSEAVEWAKHANAKFWRHGNSPDGRRGIWLCFPEFASGRKPTLSQAAE